MPCDQAEFMRRFIHFVDNKDKKQNGHEDYSPIFKVKYVLDKLMKGMQAV